MFDSISTVVEEDHLRVYGKVAGKKEHRGLGGGFRYCKLDRPLFDETGNIGSEVKFGDLAAHAFFAETGRPIPKPMEWVITCCLMVCLVIRL